MLALTSDDSIYDDLTLPILLVPRRWNGSRCHESPSIREPLVVGNRAIVTSVYLGKSVCLLIAAQNQRQLRRLRVLCSRP
jgi:hypothetical protein